MGIITYVCRGKDGSTKEVATLQEARDFVDTYGGTYERKITNTISTSEGYSRVGHRVGGKQGSKH